MTTHHQHAMELLAKYRATGMTPTGDGKALGRLTAYQDYLIGTMKDLNRIVDEIAELKTKIKYKKKEDQL